MSAAEYNPAEELRKPAQRWAHENRRHVIERLETVQTQFYEVLSEYKEFARQDDYKFFEIYQYNNKEYAGSCVAIYFPHREGVGHALYLLIGQEDDLLLRAYDGSPQPVCLGEGGYIFHNLDSEEARRRDHWGEFDSDEEDSHILLGLMKAGHSNMRSRLDLFSSTGH